MGAYLPKPKTEKTTITGKNNKMSFAATGMQGTTIKALDFKLNAFYLVIIFIAHYYYY